MTIKDAEKELWHEILVSADFNNDKDLQNAINNLKNECKRVYSKNSSTSKKEKKK